MVRWGDAYNVETVNVSLVDPFLHLVCDLLWCADGCCAETADGDVLADCLLCPFGDFRSGLGPAFDGRSIPLIRLRSG